VIRTTAFNDVINEYMESDGDPPITVTQVQGESLEDVTLTAIMDAFPARPELNAIYIDNCMYEGSGMAMKNLGRYYPVGHPEHIVWIGQDDTPAALAALRENTIDAVAVNSPWAIGDACGKAVLNYVVLGKPLPGEATPYGKDLYFGMEEPLTPETVEISPYGGPCRWGDMFAKVADPAGWPILDLTEWGMPTPTYQELLEQQ